MRSTPGILASAVLVAMCLLAGAAASPGQAQQSGSIQGRVTRSGTQQPLVDARILVRGMGRGGLTDAHGNFLITSVPPGQYHIRIEAGGYRPTERAATVRSGGTTGMDIELLPAGIDEPLVRTATGTLAARALGYEVAVIHAPEVVGSALVPDMHSLLSGRVPGVVVQPKTGMIGGGARIRIRGASSLLLSSEPLVYVDGIRVDNPVGWSQTSRLNDFSPEDVERIQVVKGAAAALYYGVDAANGVIDITTKQGHAGRPRFDVDVRLGRAEFASYEELIPTNYWRNPESGAIESLSLASSERTRGTPLFEAGALQRYRLSVSGGSEAVRYFAAGNYNVENGIVPNNDLKRFSGRANVSVQPHRTVELLAGTGYTSGRTYAGGTSILEEALVASPQFLHTPLPNGESRRGFRFYASELHNEYEDFEDVGRFTGTVQLTHRPVSWFEHRLSFGTDAVQEEDQRIFRRSELAMLYAPARLGSHEVFRHDVSYRTIDYGAQLRWLPRRAVTAITALGVQRHRRRSESQLRFEPGPVRAETFERHVAVGGYAHQTVGVNERLFLSAGLRADDINAAGTRSKYVYSHYVGASWVVTETPRAAGSWLNRLRLRSAYTRTFLPPTARSFAPLSLDELLQLPGDPERSRGVEAGVDADLLNHRAALALTLYRTQHSDLIIPVPAPSPVRYRNSGALTNTGLELSVRVSPVRRGAIGVDVRATAGTNDSEILDRGPFYVAEREGLLHRTGHPAGSWFFPRLVAAQLDEQGRFIRASLLCATTDGRSEPCYDASGNFVAERLYVGRALPRYEGTLGSTVTLFDRLRFDALVEYRAGYRKWNGVLHARCSRFDACIETMNPAGTDPVLVASYQSPTTFDAPFTADASFAKLRELSLTYELSPRLTHRFGVRRAAVVIAGRNLATWSRWNGLDPESGYLNDTPAPFAQGEDFALPHFAQGEGRGLPQLRRFTTSLRISF